MDLIFFFLFNTRFLDVLTHGGYALSANVDDQYIEEELKEGEIAGNSKVKYWGFHENNNVLKNLTQQNWKIL
jgi:hypothetical protein